ncbi:MAG: homoserine kinase [Bacteroidota bacterium]
MKQRVTVFAPATVSNVGPGFDLLGFALETPGDHLEIRRNHTGRLTLMNASGCNLPLEPATNVAAVAAKALLEELGEKEGFDIIFRTKINPGSGIGSSAASCVAAVTGINILLGSPLKREELLPFAMEGEAAASGAWHADNIAPALLGGFTLIRSYDPMDINHIPYPDDLWCAIAHPSLEIRTAESRKLVPTTVPLSVALAQAGNLAGLITGLTTGNFDLIGRSVTDHFAEPYRMKQIPGFAALKKEVLESGATAFGISGSGPSVFALTRGGEQAEKSCRLMKQHFESAGLSCAIYTSRISREGAREIKTMSFETGLSDEVLLDK